MAITVALLATSCNEKRELESQSARDAPEAVRQISDAGPGSSAALQSAEMKYGKPDADGFPVDQSLEMNSDKMSKDQRMELRQQPPPGYQVGEPMHPRFSLGKANDQDEKYHPIRSTLLEIEFIHSEGGDKLINGTNKEKARKESMKELAKALIKSQKEFVVEDN